MARPHVLIIEHAEAVRLELERVLGNEFNVLTAEDTATGLSLVREHHPTIVLLAIDFPRCPDDPEEGLRFIREIRKLGSIGKVIVCKGSGYPPAIGSTRSGR